MPPHASRPALGPSQRALAMWLGAWLAIQGCAGVWDRNVPLPDRHAVVLDQLKIHSDFHLPQHHRLLEDLRLLRASVQTKLGLPTSDEPIHVYLFETETQFKAFHREHFPDFPSRRAFFVQSDTTLAVYAQWGDRIAEDLRHEVAHGYLHAIVPNIPLWLDEGLAEYFEAPRGTAGVNKPHVELISAEMAAGKWRPNLERLEQLSAAGDMTQQDYAEAWAWVHLCLESSPPLQQTLTQYLNALRQNTPTEPLSVQLRRLTPQPQQAVAGHVSLLVTRG